MTVKTIYPSLLSEDLSSRIEERHMLETSCHHRGTRYYVLFISRENMGLLVTSLVDMSLKLCNTFILQRFSIIQPEQKPDTFFGFPNTIPTTFIPLHDKFPFVF